MVYSNVLQHLSWKYYVRTRTLNLRSLSSPIIFLKTLGPYIDIGILVFWVLERDQCSLWISSICYLKLLILINLTMGACNFLSPQLILFILEILQLCEASCCTGFWTTKTPKLLLEKNFHALSKYRAANIQILDLLNNA